MEMQLLAARKRGGGKGWREQATLSQWWKLSELQGLLFICSIAREILRDVWLSFTFYWFPVSWLGRTHRHCCWGGRGDTGGISKQSLIEVEDIIPSPLSGWKSSLGSNLIGSTSKWKGAFPHHLSRTVQTQSKGLTVGSGGSDLPPLNS